MPVERGWTLRFHSQTMEKEDSQRDGEHIDWADPPPQPGESNHTSVPKLAEGTVDLLLWIGRGIRCTIHRSALDHPVLEANPHSGCRSQVRVVRTRGPGMVPEG